MRANLPNNVQGSRASAPSTPEPNAPAEPPALLRAAPAARGGAADVDEGVPAFLFDRSAARQAALMAALQEGQGSGDTRVPAREPVLGDQGGTGAQHPRRVRWDVLAPAPQGAGLPGNPAAQALAQPHAMAAPSRPIGLTIPYLGTPHPRILDPQQRRVNLLPGRAQTAPPERQAQPNARDANPDHNLPNPGNMGPLQEQAGLNRLPERPSARRPAQLQAMAGAAAEGLPDFPFLAFPLGQPLQRNLPRPRNFRTPPRGVELVPRRPENPRAERQAGPDARDTNPDEAGSTPPPR